MNILKALWCAVCMIVPYFLWSFLHKRSWPLGWFHFLWCFLEERKLLKVKLLVPGLNADVDKLVRLIYTLFCSQLCDSGQRTSLNSLIKNVLYSTVWKKTSQLKWAKIWPETLPKKMHRWHKSIWKMLNTSVTRELQIEWQWGTTHTYYSGYSPDN